MAIVYIVDDDALIRRSLAGLLKSAGHTATCFESGEAFLASETVAQACCILLDLKLGGMNGLDVQRALIERGTSIPVIFISSHGEEEVVDKALRQGAIAFFHKPFSVDRILALIDETGTRQRSAASPS
ncbi:response regulator [Burkholderia sp. JPY481]|uniref:response regulator transcription factor n=1 Tax=unclassified Paraburkholderia TaxID=2615204 RepID=UPI00316CCFAE